ncbi:DedA family protein [Actinacidiphila acididurans]|uniref:VTT domain-containing protein n=1 Tax=Actinacidiphila acididurans TaxID=2784346 RepID=A0ABS2TIK9_9ACTN|nr:VTT domain-containing protein [Actinacidiphila acididurans]MBM9503174.1 VTT domain-containing protein [Actinacidiphila acididurans]
MRSVAEPALHHRWSVVAVWPAVSHTAAGQSAAARTLSAAGRRHGRRVGLTPQRLTVGRYLFDRRGGKVVFYCRFISGLRTFVAFLAGTVEMRRSRFVLANTAGALARAPLFAFGAHGLGFLVRRSRHSLKKRADAAYPYESGPAGALLVTR